MSPPKRLGQLRVSQGKFYKAVTSKAKKGNKTQDFVWRHISKDKYESAKAREGGHTRVIVPVVFRHSGSPLLPVKVEHSSGLRSLGIKRAPINWRSEYGLGANNRSAGGRLYKQTRTGVWQLASGQGRKASKRQREPSKRQRALLDTLRVINGGRASPGGRLYVQSHTGVWKLAPGQPRKTSVRKKRSPSERQKRLRDILKHSVHGWASPGGRVYDQTSGGIFKLQKLLTGKAPRKPRTNKPRKRVRKLSDRQKQLRARMTALKNGMFQSGGGRFYEERGGVGGILRLRKDSRRKAHKKPRTALSGAFLALPALPYTGKKAVHTRFSG